MMKQKIILESIVPLLPERLPEEDAFLYSVNYDSWIKGFFIRSNNKEELLSLIIFKRGASYAQKT